MHYHVAHGLAGYGPDTDENTPTFETLGEALEYAREELAGDIDIAHDTAHACGEAGDFEQAWAEVLRMESLENLRANLDPARRDAPLYRDDPVAYAALQESQAAMFPVDAYGPAGRLYLWDCDETECLEELES